MRRPTILLGGGYDKDSEYTEWINNFDGKVKKLILMGATKEKIARDCEKCDSMIMCMWTHLKKL